MAKTKILIIDFSGGRPQEKVEFPSEWVTSFGPAAVGKADGHNKMPTVLRIYADKGKKDLKAVFDSVKAIRYEGELKVMVKRTKTKVRSGMMEVGGQMKAVQASVKETDWVDKDRDDVDNENASLVEEEFGDVIIQRDENLLDQPKPKRSINKVATRQGKA